MLKPAFSSSAAAAALLLFASASRADKPAPRPAPGPVPVTVTNAPLAVSVTNGAAVFKHSPLRRMLTAQSMTYVVPAGNRLVVESIEADVTCRPEADPLLIVKFVSADDPAEAVPTSSLPLVRSGSFGIGSVISSVKWILGPGETLGARAICGSFSANFEFVFHGYLVSADSPVP